MLKKILSFVLIIIFTVCIFYISYSFYEHDALFLVVTVITATFYIVFSWLMSLITKKP